MKRLTRADFTEMPWRNGGGVTQEIAKLEDDAGLLWRISTARVEADGAYSRFPGLMRRSVVVEGNGVRLSEQQTGRVIQVRDSDIAELSGDADFHGVLLDGGIRHLNLVFDPKRVSVEMAFVSAGKITLNSQKNHALYCVAGAIRSEDGQSIGQGEVLIGQEAGSLVIDENARGVLISLVLK